MPFNSTEFKADLTAKEQSLSLSGIGAHHQNGVAERVIQTGTQWARAMLLHPVLHWPNQAQLDLWPFAMERADYLWNHLPKKDSLLAPVELFTGAVFDNYNHIQRAHVWGCPTYVLDPRLQDGKKIPKWDPRSWRGMFVGVSHAHSSNISRWILNLCTGHVSPQYHAVYDDLFSTIPNAESGGVDDQMSFNPRTWNQIVNTGHERTVDPVEEASTGTRYVPSLDKEWLLDDELLQQNEGTTIPAPIVQSEDQQPQLLQGPILPPAPDPVVEPSPQVSPQVLPPEG